MKKILILQNTILHYRKPFYNKLAEQYDVTVLHSGKVSVNKEDIYKEIITPVKSISKFKFQKGVLKEVRSEKYDFIIAMMDIFWIFSIISSFIHPKKSGFAWWGIIAGKSEKGNKIRGLFLRNKPTIFYNEDGLQKLAKLGYQSDNYTFCTNTFHIENRIECFKEEEKDSFLFVGSLDKRKNIEILIRAFHQAIPNIPEKIKLKIIGDGEDYKLASDLIKELNLKTRVSLEGRITETSKLEKYYKKAILAVSFGQAGLGVLQSLGYGVAFLTYKNAISGGEISNIKHQQTGILCEDSMEDLSKYFIHYSNDITSALKMGENAYNYYTENCTLEHMIKKFSEVIDKKY